MHRKSHILAACVIVLLTLLAYSPAMLYGGFIWDDDDYVTENGLLHDADGLSRIWLDPGATHQYYPLVFTTFWAEYQLWDLNPTGFHVVNVLLHAATSVLLWLVLRRIFPTPAGVAAAWVAAAIFAVHPVHVESVAWITERKNVLSGLFYMLAMLSYFRFAGLDSGAAIESQQVNKSTSQRPVTQSPSHLVTPSSAAWYLASLAFFIAALLSKTVTCSLPAALLLVLWWRKPAMTWRDVLPTLPMFALGLGGALITAHFEEEHVGAAGAAYDFSFIERCLIAGRALWFYAAKLVVPANLSFIYERWTIDPRVWWQWVYPAAALAVIAVLWLAAQRRGPAGRGPLVAVLFFAGTLVPALGFINVFPMRFSFVADHFQYLASIGLIALGVGMVAKLVARMNAPRVGAALAAIALVTSTGLSWQRCFVYENLETLWRDTTIKNRTGWLPWHNLAAELVNDSRELEARGLHDESRRKLSEAAAHYEQANRNDPTYADTYVNLADIRLRQGNLAAAQRLYEECLRVQPQWVIARHNLANLLAQQGRLDEAITHYSAVVAIKPDFVDSQINLGRLLLQQGRRDEALIHLRAAASAGTAMTLQARLTCGDGFFLAGQFHEAGEQYQRVMDDQPSNAQAARMLGLSLANQKHYEGAIRWLERSLELEPGNADAIEALVRLYTQVGRTDDAARMQRQLPRR